MIKLLADLPDHAWGFAVSAKQDDSEPGVAHSTAWDRIAAVTEVDWIANAVQTVAFLLPALVRVFPYEARTDAEKRIAA